MGMRLNLPLPHRGSGSEGGAGDRSAAAASTHPSGWPSPCFPGDIEKREHAKVSQSMGGCRYHRRVACLMLFVNT